MIILPNQNHSTIHDDVKHMWNNVFTPTDAIWALRKKNLNTINEDLISFQEKQAELGYRMFNIHKSMRGWQLRGNDAAGKEIVITNEDFKSFMAEIKSFWLTQHSSYEILFIKSSQDGEFISKWLEKNKDTYYWFFDGNSKNMYKHLTT
jgi:hypothetical protein